MNGFPWRAMLVGMALGLLVFSAYKCTRADPRIMAAAIATCRYQLDHAGTARDTLNALSDNVLWRTEGAFRATFNPTRCKDLLPRQAERP